MRTTKVIITITDGRPVVELDGEPDAHVVSSMVDAWGQVHGIELAQYLAKIRKAKEEAGKKE